MKYIFFLIAIAFNTTAFSAELPLEACCRYCTTNSKPCGNACIPLSYSCSKPEGCACSSANPRPGQGAIYQQGFSDGYSLGYGLQWEKRETDLKERFKLGYQDALRSLQLFITRSPRETYNQDELLLLIDGVAHALSLMDSQIPAASQSK